MSIDIVSEIRLILEEHKHFSLYEDKNVDYLAGMIAEALDEEQVDDRQIDMFTGTDKNISEHPMGVGFGDKDEKSNAQKIEEHKIDGIEYSEFAHLTTDHKDEVKYDGDGKKLEHKKVKSYGFFKNEYYDD